MGDLGGDGSLDEVIVKVSRRFNLFWILHGATSWDHLEASLTPSGMSGMSGRPRMGHFGGEGSFDWIIVKVSKKFNLF